MSFSRYIKEHWIWTIWFAFIGLSVEAILFLFNFYFWVMIYFAIVMVTGYFFSMYVEYSHSKRYLPELQEKVEAIEESYLVYEMMLAEDTQEEQILKEVFYQMEVGMNEKVSQYKENVQDYKEYMETWVHEIKIPLATQRMILANMKDGTSELGAEIDRIEGYVEQALFYARSNEVEKDYLVTSLVMQDVVNEVLRKERKRLREKRVELSLEDLDIEVMSDAKWIAFILGQLMDNCIKYAPAEEPLKLKMYCEKKAEAVVFHLIDNGLGIKASEVDRVFEKGFTGTNGRIGKKSTGFGLYLCKKLSNRLGHEIAIKSTEGEGTEVMLIFPVSSMTEIAL